MEIIDKSFKLAPKSFIIQSLLAVFTVAIILYFVKVLTHAAIVAALGASAFIVFAMPCSVYRTTKTANRWACCWNALRHFFYYVFLTGPLGKLINGWEFTTLFVYTLAVGLSIFLMAITNTEHPPAAGTTLGIVGHAWSYQVVIFILLFAVGLAVVRRLLGSRLKDLV